MQDMHNMQDMQNMQNIQNMQKKQKMKKIHIMKHHLQRKLQRHIFCIGIHSLDGCMNAHNEHNFLVKLNQWQRAKGE